LEEMILAHVAQEKNINNVVESSLFYKDKNYRWWRK